MCKTHFTFNYCWLASCNRYMYLYKLCLDIFILKRVDKNTVKMGLASFADQFKQLMSAAAKKDKLKFK